MDSASGAAPGDAFIDSPAAMDQPEVTNATAPAAPPQHQTGFPASAASVGTLPIIDHVRQNFGPVLGHLLEREVFTRGWMNVDVETLHINLRSNADNIFQQFASVVQMYELHGAVMEMLAVILSFAHGETATHRLLVLLADNYPTQVLFSAMLNPQMLKSLVESANLQQSHPGSMRASRPGVAAPHHSANGTNFSAAGGAGAFHNGGGIDDHAASGAASAFGPVAHGRGQQRVPNANSPPRGSPTSAGPAIPQTRSARLAAMQQGQQQPHAFPATAGPAQPQQPMAIRGGQGQDLSHQQQQVARAQAQLQHALGPSHQNLFMSNPSALAEQSRGPASELAYRGGTVAPPPLQPTHMHGNGMGYQQTTPSISGSMSYPASGYASSEFTTPQAVSSVPQPTQQQPSTPANVPFSPLAAAFSSKPKAAASTPTAPPPTPATPATNNLAASLIKSLTEGHGGAHLSQSSTGIVAAAGKGTTPGGKAATSPKWADGDAEELNVKVSDEGALAAFLEQHSLSPLYDVLAKNTTLARLRNMPQVEFDENALLWVASKSKRTALWLALHPTGQFTAVPAPASQQGRGKPEAAPGSSSAVAQDVHYIKVILKPPADDDDPAQPRDSSFRQASRTLASHFGKQAKFSEVLWQTPKGAGPTYPVVVFTIPAAHASSINKCDTEHFNVDGIRYSIEKVTVSANAPKHSSVRDSVSAAVAQAPTLEQVHGGGHHHGGPMHHDNGNTKFSRATAATSAPAVAAPLPRSPKVRPAVPLDNRTPPRAGQPRTPDHDSSAPGGHPPPLAAGDRRQQRGAPPPAMTSRAPPPSHEFRSDDVRGMAQMDDICRYFNTNAGCKRGDSCMYRHDAHASVPRRKPMHSGGNHDGADHHYGGGHFVPGPTRTFRQHGSFGSAPPSAVAPAPHDVEGHDDDGSARRSRGRGRGGSRQPADQHS